MASADRLTVDLEGLERFATDLDTIRSGMGTASNWMLEFSGDLGGQDVDDALEHFESNWSDGRSQVDENCQRLVKMTQQAVENLRKADDDLAKQLRDSTEGS